MCKTFQETVQRETWRGLRRQRRRRLIQKAAQGPEVRRLREQHQTEAGAVREGKHAAQGAELEAGGGGLGRTQAWESPSGSSYRMRSEGN